jgi:polyhydroxyalkanoate synthesis regulator phasin
MAVVVFECPIDEATLASIQELRLLRIEVLQRQIQQIDKVVETLLEQGTLQADERGPYREVILAELQEKCEELQSRLDSRETVYSDELELYLDVLTAE